MTTHTYLLALGSNQRHSLFGGPREMLKTAVDVINGAGNVLAMAPIIDSAPIGPSRRTYANSAIVFETELGPANMLRVAKALERTFGTRRGQAWSARVLDVDIILWSGGIYASPSLAIPHRLFRTRDFVLKPAAAIAPDWRDPVTGWTLRHLWARWQRPRVDIAQ